MKLIFLDIDGVLNTGKTVETFNGQTGLCPDRLKLFENILIHTDASFVISSALRNNNQYVSYLLRSLIDIAADRYKGKTPNIYGGNSDRGTQIQKWIDDNKYTGEFIILDDVDNMGHLSHKLVKTFYDDGLTRRIADRVINILNGHGDTKPKLKGTL